MFVRPAERRLIGFKSCTAYKGRAHAVRFCKLAYSVECERNNRNKVIAITMGASPRPTGKVSCAPRVEMAR